MRSSRVGWISPAVLIVVDTAPLIGTAGGIQRERPLFNQFSATFATRKTV
jgi:hypothetical protein